MSNFPEISITSGRYDTVSNDGRLKTNRCAYDEVLGQRNEHVEEWAVQDPRSTGQAASGRERTEWPVETGKGFVLFFNNTKFSLIINRPFVSALYLLVKPSQQDRVMTRSAKAVADMNVQETNVSERPFVTTLMLNLLAAGGGDQSHPDSIQDYDCLSDDEYFDASAWIWNVLNVLDSVFAMRQFSEYSRTFDKIKFKLQMARLFFSDRIFLTDFDHAFGQS